MRRIFCGAVIVSVMAGAVAAQASECNRSSLNGEWFLSSGGQLVCEVNVSAQGRADGACRIASDDERSREPVPFKGRFILNKRCEVLIRMADVDFVGEARGWSTQRANRIDMLGGVLGWKVEEGTTIAWKVEEGEAIIGFMANRRAR